MGTFKARDLLIVAGIFAAAAFLGQCEFAKRADSQVINPGTPTLPPPPANNDCVKYVVVGGSVQGITTAGAACQTTAGTVSSVSNSDGSLTISPTAGAVIASLNPAHANTWTALQTFNANANFATNANIQFGGVAAISQNSTYLFLQSPDSTTGFASVVIGPHTDTSVYVRGGQIQFQDVAGVATHIFIAQNMPAMSATNLGGIAASATNGIQIAGNGSVNDYSILNKALTSVCNVPTGATTLNCTALSIGGGTPMTITQGNGTKLQSSTGTTTTNDCVKYDANGNAIDAGGNCAWLSGAVDGSLPIYEGIHANSWLTNKSIGNQFYVSTTGSDTNNICNVLASPCQHIQYAVQRAVEYGIANPTINLGSGTFNESVNFGGMGFPPGQVNSNIITISGAGSANTTWNGQSGLCGTLIANTNANVDITNVTILGTGDACQSSIFSNLMATVNIFPDVKFGAASVCQIWSEDLSEVQIWNVYSITGGAGCHVAATTLSMVSYNFVGSVTVTGTPNFSTAFAQATQGGLIDMNSATFTGAATGKRFIETSEGSISFSGNPNVLFPGNATGNYAGTPVYGSTGETQVLSNTTNFCGLASCNTSGGVGSSITSPTAGTIKDLYVYSASSPGGAQTYTVTIDIDGSLSAMTCQISAAGSSCVDTTHTAAVQQGSKIFFQVVMSATATSSTFSFGAVMRQ